MTIASLITLIIVLVIIGVVLYLIESKIPMDDTIKVVLRVVIVIACCLFLLDFFGVYSLPLRG